MYKLISTLVLLFVSQISFSMTEKICFGSTRSDDTKGAILGIKVDQNKIAIKTLKRESGQDWGEGIYDGSKIYPTYNRTSTSRNGKVFNEYKGEKSEYQDVIMVESVLLEENSQGLLQIRRRGEGFFNFAFFCKNK